MSELEKTLSSGATLQMSRAYLRGTASFFMRGINRERQRFTTQPAWGHRGVVEELVRQGANINAADTQYGATPTG